LKHKQSAASPNTGGYVILQFCFS